MLNKIWNELPEKIGNLRYLKNLSFLSDIDYILSELSKKS